VSRVTTIKNGGGRLHWSRSNVVAFDQLGADQYFDVFTMSPDGANEVCLTCGRSELPGRHMGNPEWHPSGDYIAFQAQKASAPRNPISDFFANPGSGINNDLWIMNRQGTRFWRMTDVPLQNGGVLHPHFSPNGDRLLWSERLSAAGGPIGEWALKIADFRTTDGVPRIENVQRHQPGRQRRFYESHGFTPDGTKIIFSGNLEPGQEEGGGDIYVFDPASGDLQNLTNSPDQWDEHAQMAPAGDWIVWMSSMGVGGDRARPRSDYWIMRADGSDKRQITFFNAQGERDFIPGGVTAADSSWSPDGSRLLGYLILHETLTAARMLVIDFSRSVTTDTGAPPEDTRGPIQSMSAPAANAGRSSDELEAATIAATEDNPGALGAWNARVDRLVRLRHLDLAASISDPAVAGRTLDRFIQRYDGVPVLGGEIVRQRAGTRPLSIFGTIYPVSEIDTDPALTAPEAAQVLERQLTEPLLAPPDVQRLVIVPQESGRPALAYEIRALTTTEILIAVVDARSGTVLTRYRDAHAGPPALRGAGDGIDSQRLAGPDASGRTAQAVTLTYDMRGDARRTVEVLVDPRSRSWIGSFAALRTDDSAAAVGRSVAAAVAYLRQRHAGHPLDTGPSLIPLVHPADIPAEGGMPLLTSDALYAGGGVLVAPDARFDTGEVVRRAQIAHQIGHALVDVTSGLAYHGDAGALNEAVALLVQSAVPDSGGAILQDSEPGAQLVLDTLVSAIGPDGAAAHADRARLEAAYLRALTQLLPPNASLRMARGATLQALRDFAGEPRAELHRRLAEAWDRAGVRQD
jgi:Tol biopolymer transport system component